jgi:tetratricopeptide (TPR) repeat protein
MLLRSLSLLTLTALLAACVTQAIDNDYNRLHAYYDYQNGRFADAQRKFEAIVADDPTDVKAHYYLGLIGLNALNDPGYARRHLEICNTVNHARRVQRNAPIHANTGVVPFPAEEQVADALAEALYRLNNAPQLTAFLQDQVAIRGSAHDYLRQAHYLQLLGDPDSARTAIIKAVKVRTPKDTQPYIALGDFYVSIGNTPEAVIAYRKAYGIDPINPDTSAKLRSVNIVPGPTAALPPDNPETLRL